MTTAGLWQLALYFVVLVVLVKPLGWYMARVYEGQPTGLDRWLGPVERWLYRVCGIRADLEMRWKHYAGVVLAFNGVGFVVLFVVQRLQAYLPLNPLGLPGVAPDSAFNTSVSFTSNTNWQGYPGETTMTYLTQMLGLGVQNFLSAATGMAVLVALIRGFARRTTDTVGNFWVDLVRSVLYILLPLSCVLAILLVSQGVVQSLGAPRTMALVEPTRAETGERIAERILPLGPAGSQVAIKQLGTNGGGFFNTNSSHPFENPTPLSNFLELVAILLIPASFCYTFGMMVGDTRQGWALLAAKLIVFTGLLAICIPAEQAGTPQLAGLGADLSANDRQAGGNMEGKEVRFGIVSSALWATATTAASNGSVNSMHDSYTPLGGMVAMWMIQIGEVVFGGVGSGLYGMLMFAIVTVFVAGLMIGRTPEYLGKKIESYEMKMASIAILIPPMIVLTGTAVAMLLPSALASRANPGPHGFSEILYAFSSAGNNNGSAFAGLNANTVFYNCALGFTMLLGRYWVMIPALAVAGSLARKKYVPVSAGTLPTHGPLFVVLLIAVVVVVGALSFMPALALGPIVEHLQMVQPVC